ncbi:MAG: hypothetical protein J3Q66DRAFT_400929 [Benniella sp.]|nr:MAG: hypothetical protein J3Q66DRAFT_400929 [Benniella sp.]
MNESRCPGHTENPKTVRQRRSRGCMFEGPGQCDTDYSPTLQLVRMTAKAWPMEHLPLYNILGLLKLNNYCHTSSSFQVFESLLSAKEPSDAPNAVLQEEAQRPKNPWSRSPEDVARVGFLESSGLQGMMKETGHGARIFQESIVPVVQLFSTIVLNLESTNPVFVHSLTVDWLKQLITHCITNEKIGIAEQEMKEDRDLCHHHRHQRRVSTFASKARVARTLDISTRASQPCSEPITEPFFPLIVMHRFTPAFTRKLIWMSSCQRLSVRLDPLQS